MMNTVSHDHDHDTCVADALAAAERICGERSARLTPDRRRVLELVWGSHDVIGAYEILAELQKEDPSAKPPTVYRALDFLIKLGLIHRIESANGFTRCEEPDRHRVCQFLVCDECGLVEELHSRPLARSLTEQAEQSGFHPTWQTVEVHGLCRNCSA
ncbi:MAG: Fur family transcriptional regulator [Gammaproteobacteria bacterium]|nr:Fur family transcriptional regulator [Gammaproteobacteria bacterium]